MKLFVDTGSIREIEAIAALGILDGVTTNPSLLAKEEGDYRENLRKICEIVNGPVSGEVTATDFAGMIREGHDIAKIHEHMVVKVPLTRDGIRACKALSTEGLRVNVTLCFSAAQALLAAKARLGADIATCPPSVIEALFNHPLTASGLEKFLKDWEKAQTVKA
jgi:transaldolase